MPEHIDIIYDDMIISGSSARRIGVTVLSEEYSLLFSVFSYIFTSIFLMFPQYAIPYSFGNWISTLHAVNLTILDVYTFSLKKHTSHQNERMSCLVSFVSIVCSFCGTN